MAPVLPGLLHYLRRRTQLARRMLRPATKDELKVYKGAWGRAKKAGIKFKLSKHDFDVLVTRADGRCEDTGARFSNIVVPGDRYRRQRLSIDRIDSSRPYILDNCRLVTAAVNFSKSDLSFQQFHVQKLLYYAQMGGKIDDAFVLRKRGDHPEDWLY